MAEGTEERSQNETVYAAALDRVCVTFGVQTSHEEQRKAIDTFFEGKDIFVSLLTTYGKSVIFQAIPVIALILSKKPYTIFIVSPLKALMEDQVQYLDSLGLKAIALSEQFDESTRTNIYSLTWRESGLKLAIMSFFRCELNETKRDTRFVPLQ